MATLELHVVTAEGELFSGEADFVVAPAALGEITVLPSHAPLITTLATGELRVRQGAEETSLAVSGGFMEVRSNRVTVLADAAEEAGAIDLERAEEAMRQAQERLAQAGEEVDLERALATLGRAQVRVRLARRRRERAGGSSQRPGG